MYRMASLIEYSINWPSPSWLRSFFRYQHTDAQRNYLQKEGRENLVLKDPSDTSNPKDIKKFIDNRMFLYPTDDTGYYKAWLHDEVNVVQTLMYEFRNIRNDDYGQLILGNILLGLKRIFYALLEIILVPGYLLAGLYFSFLESTFFQYLYRYVRYLTKEYYNQRKKISHYILSSFNPHTTINPSMMDKAMAAVNYLKITLSSIILEGFNFVYYLITLIFSIPVTFFQASILFSSHNREVLAYRLQGEKPYKVNGVEFEEEFINSNLIKIKFDEGLTDNQMNRQCEVFLNSLNSGVSISDEYEYLYMRFNLYEDLSLLVVELLRNIVYNGSIALNAVLEVIDGILLLTVLYPCLLSALDCDLKSPEPKSFRAG